MTNHLKDLVIRIELHDVQGIRNCFSKGIDPNMLFKGEPLIYELTSEYTRSPLFKECVKAFVDFGMEFPEGELLAVLLDDAAMLDKLIKAEPALVSKKYTLRCAYTPLFEATLLHICAEFNHVSCAEVLVTNGAAINARAGIDEYGFGGQTPIFHTVNQNRNQSEAMMQYLLSQSADLKLTVAGLIWGKGYDWETCIPAVNPVSYAMMGMLPQMHREEKTIATTISTLLKHGYGIHYTPQNIPCKYLSGK